MCCFLLFSFALFVVCFVVAFLLKCHGFVSYGFRLFLLTLPLFVRFVSGCVILHFSGFAFVCCLLFVLLLVV